jgi:hypothetical protein
MNFEAILAGRSYFFLPAPAGSTPRFLTSSGGRPGKQKLPPAEGAGGRAAKTRILFKKKPGFYYPKTRFLA